MAISERTYTFRASADLGDRMRDASHVLAELAAQPGSRLTERISREVGMTIARRGGLAGTGLTGENQSAFLREIVELIVHAAQKVANDIAWEKVYAEEYLPLSEEEQAFIRASERIVGERWRDE